RIASFGIVRYTPQSDEPQLVLRKNRVAATDLSMDLKAYGKRKEYFIQRVKTMVAYLQESSCRSRFISHYFGDADAKPCGICDNCLSQKAVDFSAEEFNAIAAVIKQQLETKKQTAEELVADLSTIKKEKTWQVLRFLQAEKQISADGKGLLQNK
ncbi:MAG: RecQ family ATP-dependent DNA helicase, partial [Chitinophagaceae bacterium]